MKRALISVYYKEGIDILAQKLVNQEWEILSTGGTAIFLRDKNIPVTEISSQTGFPEVLDGRVKTLHPYVFGGILATSSEKHLGDLKKISSKKINLVIVNFYPFEEAVLKQGQSLNQMIETIDIGGPSMVRAAAKNFAETIVVVDKDDYTPVINLIISNNDIPLEQRKDLAQKAFSYTSFYDSLIASYLFDKETALPSYFNLAGRKKQDLRYGENPHQKGALYITDQNSPLFTMEKLQGKKLSFNNILDLSMVYDVLSCFKDTAEAFTVIVKHQNPCGAAIGNTQGESFYKAFEGDSLSSFGGIVGFNQTLDEKTALKMIKIFFEVIIAPDFSKEALEILGKKKKLRLIKVSLNYSEKYDIKKVPGGFVIQDKDNLISDINTFESKTPRQLTDQEQKDLEFGWKIMKFVKSNGIIIVKDQKLIGVGAGQMSRIDAVHLSIKKSQSPIKDAILLSDAFFPFADSIEAAAKEKISVIVEPGGSIRDDEVIKAAKESGISLIFTGVRHFRH